MFLFQDTSTPKTPLMNNVGGAFPRMTTISPNKLFGKPHHSGAGLQMPSTPLGATNMFTAPFTMNPVQQVSSLDCSDQLLENFHMIWAV